MIAPTVLARVIAAGGKLWLAEDGVRYRLPPAARPLLPELRARRGEVVQFLQAAAAESAAASESANRANLAASGGSRVFKGDPSESANRANLAASAARQPRPDPWMCSCGSRHGTCAFSRRCPLECPCNSCAVWRRAEAWSAAHPRQPVIEPPRAGPPNLPPEGSTVRGAPAAPATARARRAETQAGWDAIAEWESL